MVDCVNEVLNTGKWVRVLGDLGYGIYFSIIFTTRFKVHGLNLLYVHKENTTGETVQHS